MKYTLFILLFVLLWNNNYAQRHHLNKKKSHQLTYDEFVTQYGNNDTTMIMIDYYFDKHDNTGIGKMSFLPLSTSIAFIIPPLGVGLMTVSSPLFVSGLITSNKYNRKKLLIALKDYQRTGQLPHKFEKKFNQILEIQEEIRNEEMLAERYASLKAIKSK